MKKSNAFLIVFGAGLLTLALHSFAIEKETKHGFHTMDEKLILPRISMPPRIDGAFDEEIYDKFLKLDNFFQLFPIADKPASEKTEAFLAYDDNNIYLGVKAFTADHKKIRASICKRDNFDYDDSIEFIIDPFLTKVRGFSFTVNPYGIQKDGIYDEPVNPAQADRSWDTLFFSKGKIYEWGYFVELKIPFKSFRFPGKKDFQQWGFQLSRTTAETGEFDTLFYHDRNKRGWMSQEGSMTLNGNIKKGFHLEFVPYFSALKNKGKKIDTNAGFSFKYGISTDSTLDFTYNPDFSHIEADAGQININQRYALYYDEKRPFFLEGNEVFKSPIEVFYSRRIGSPRFGAKLSGRSGKSVFGLISAFDKGSFRNLSKVIGGGEENCYINVFRYKYEFKKENYVGVFITDKREKNNIYNNVIGLDAHLKHKNFFGDIQAIISGSNYKMKSSGHAFYGEISYKDKHITAAAASELYSPDFDAQLGFIKRVDIKRYASFFEYSFIPEKSYFIKGGPRLYYEYITDWKGIVQDKSLNLSFIYRTLKNTSIIATYSKSYELFNLHGFNKKSFYINLFTSPYKFLTLQGTFNVGDGVFYFTINPFLGHIRAVSISAALQPTPKFAIDSNWISEFFYTGRGGELVYKMNIFRIKGTFLFNRNLSLRTIWEYNDYYKDHYGDILLAYEYNPGTVFYLGYSSNLMDERGRLISNSHSIYFKFSYLFLR